MCLKSLIVFERQMTNKQKCFYSNLGLPKMSRFFKNCVHLSKAISCNLLLFPIPKIRINLTEKKCFDQRLSVTRVRIKKFQF